MQRSMVICAILFCVSLASCAQTQNKVTSGQARQIERIMQDAIIKASSDKDGAQRLIEREDEFTAYIMAGFTRFTARASDFAIAHEILGDDFISPQEVAAARGLTYSEAQVAELERTLPNRETLEWLKQNDYYLVAGPPREILIPHIHELEFIYLYGKAGVRYQYFHVTEAQVRNETEAFARNEQVTCRWYMLRKGIVPNSTNKTWSEQLQLLSDFETAPTAVELIWGMNIYKAVRGVHLLGNVRACTSSVNLPGNHVFVGNFGGGGFGYNYWHGTSRHNDDLGVASALKP